MLPKGQHVPMPLVFCRLIDERADAAEAGTIKDAGDDPDVTHGALVFARVRLLAEPGVIFRAGPGVGTVTRAGLTLAGRRTGDQSGAAQDDDRSSDRTRGGACVYAAASR